MFLVMEERTFHAGHQILLPHGEWEEYHEHDWLLRVFVRAKELDSFQLVVDFLDLQAKIDSLLAPFEGQAINRIPPFSEGISPTTEYLAWLFHQRLAASIDDPRVQVFRVELREAPTSWGIYTLDSPGFQTPNP